jgi:3-oxoacyl-[acyl-carrier protein] reductase
VSDSPGEGAWSPKSLIFCWSPGASPGRRRYSKLLREAFDLQLEDQVAIITGAGGGIGAEIAYTLADAGASIVVNDVVEEAAQKVADEVESRGVRALVNTSNITDEAQVQEMVVEVMEEFGRIDILVNNAGITRDGLLVRMDEEQWDIVLDVNLKGAFLVTKAVARPMMKARAGRIINMASVSGVGGNAGQANYSASKGGLISLTKTTAQELAGRNVTCNALAPGFIETAMTHELAEDTRDAWLERIPLGRPGTAADVANAVLFLAGPGAAYITGQVINIDGGLIM